MPSPRRTGGPNPQVSRTSIGFYPLVLAGVLLAAGLGCGTPSRPEDCDGRSDRDECLSTVALGMFRDNPDAADRVAQKITDPLIRDFLYLQVTREIDPGSPRWCERIGEEVLQKRCRVLVSRPHLHRELLREAGNEPPGGPGGPGGPPPGGPPPGGPPGMPGRPPHPAGPPPEGPQGPPPGAPGGPTLPPLPPDGSGR